MQEEHVFSADFVANLSHGLQERQAFDVPHRATNFGNNNVNIGPSHSPNAGLNFIGDVRNDLYGVAQVFTPAFFCNYCGVDLSCRDIG